MAAWPWSGRRETHCWRKCLGMLEAVGKVFPEARYQRCTVRFYRNVFSVILCSKVKLVAKMLKVIHARESKKAAREKATAVVEELCLIKLKEAAKKAENSIEETLIYCDFPSEHWICIRTNNVIERIDWGDPVTAVFQTAVCLCTAAPWGWHPVRKYMNIKHLEAAVEDASIAS